MKKLLCIALFSIALMANATEKKEIVVNNSTEIVTNATGEKEIVMNNFLESENSDLKKEIFEDANSCGEQGNNLYDQLTSGPNAMSHRDARRERRTFVRECRDHIWPFPWA